MGFLHRPWHEPDVAKSVKFSLIRNPLLGPKPGDNVNAFFEACTALFHAHAADVELLWDAGASNAGGEPAVDDIIEHGQRAGELDGRVEWGYHGAGDQRDAWGAGRDGRQENNRIGTMTAVVVKVVFDCFYRGIAQRIGAFR